jgi:hypothetical protein
MRTAYAEEHYLAMLWRAFNAGRIDTTALDSLTGHVLRGGHLDEYLRPVDAPLRGSALAAEVERERRNGQRPGRTA